MAGKCHKHTSNLTLSSTHCDPEIAASDRAIRDFYVGNPTWPERPRPGIS